MKIDIIHHDEDTVRVTIACRHTDAGIDRLKRHIEACEEKIRGKSEGEIVFVELSSALYFEVVDNRSFVYTSDRVIEIEKKLHISRRYAREIKNRLGMIGG